MKLYSKIFLSFLVTLVLAELAIFGVFHVFIKEDREQRFHRLAEAQAVILREWFEHRHGHNCPDRLSPSERARRAATERAVERLSHLFRADVWIADETGRTLARSFSGPVPPPPAFQKEFRNFSMGWGRHGEGFAKLPIRLPNDRDARIFALLPPEERKTPLESAFAWALAGLGLAFALLLIPISRMLTGPLKRLQQTALEIAAGDLSRRVPVKGRARDEIGKLSHSFNTMADQIERMIRGSRELTAHVSHELRSPLARMRIAEEMLRENVDDGDRELAHKRCDAIRAEIEDLDELIGKILTLSRLEMQAAPPVREAVRIQTIAEGLIERYRPTLEKKKIALYETLAADAPAVQAVPSEVRTVLANLLDNAVKFTPENGDIRFSLESTDGWVRIRCENRTEDEPDTDLERIFEPFYRKTTNGAGGTGLGLAITQKIVKNMNGEITVERTGPADVANRVLFTIWLPVS